MNILFCTDEELMLTTLEYRFRKHGWKLDVVPKLTTLEGTLHTTAPELAVVDLQMPSEQGISIIQKLKDNSLSNIPVLVLSYLEDDEVLSRALELGVDDFITKPVKPDEMAIRIKRLIGKNTSGNKL